MKISCQLQVPAAVSSRIQRLLPLIYKSECGIGLEAVAYPGILFCWGFNKFSLGQKTEIGDLGAVAPYPLVKGSGGSCNLVQEISFHIVKVS